MKPRKIRWWVGRRGVKLQLCLLGILLAAASGCAKAQARTVPEGPPLAVPEAPARVIVPAEEPLPVVALVPEPPPAAAPRPPVRPPVRRPNGGNAAGSGAGIVGEPEPATPPAAASVPVPAPQPPALRAAPFAAAAAAERGVRDTLTRAGRDLGRVDYGRLSAEGRVQYEQSKRFTEQAEQALRDRNLPFASTLADKAATLATELLGSR